MINNNKLGGPRYWSGVRHILCGPRYWSGARQDIFKTYDELNVTMEHQTLQYTNNQHTKVND